MASLRTPALLIAALLVCACGGGGGGDEGVAPVAVSASFVHTATAANSVGSGTAIDHPLSNGRPDALLLVTPTWIAGGGGGLGVYVDHTLAVGYDTLRSAWAILYQDGTTIPIGAAFNVTVAAGGAAGPTTFFEHVADGSGLHPTGTYLDHPAVNGRPGVRLLVTLNRTPGGVIPPVHDHTFGVTYVTATSRWAVFNRDGAPTPADVAYNVAVVGTGGGSPFDVVQTHVATLANLSGTATVLSVPSDAGAIVHATVYFPSSSGVAYARRFGVSNTTGSAWEIFTQDASAPAAGPQWHVGVALP